MARYKDYNYDQAKMIPIAFKDQIFPGTFEHTLNHLVDHELNLSVFDNRYQNDETGCPAYDPAILLKIILYAYSRGIVSSRQIERCCRENVIFMALSADTQPHFTTIAAFIAKMEAEILSLFRDVLWVCDNLGLIGREMFAIDGCKLPSNASKEWSGTKAELKAKEQKLERAIRRMLKTHKERDSREVTTEIAEQEQRYLKSLRQQVKKLKAWQASHEDKPGKTGKPKKSNVTDNDSAKMKTSHGVIQGYTGIATVDHAHQVVVDAQAFGEGQEHDLLAPTIEATAEHFEVLNEEDIFESTKITADSGFHSERNMEYLATHHIDAYVVDKLFRKRDPRFQDADKYRARAREEKRKFSGASKCFGNQDFTYDPKAQTCICPAGHSLYINGRDVTINGYAAIKFKAPKRACRGCALRTQCLRHPDKTETRQVAFFKGKEPTSEESFSDKMKRKLDTVAGKWLYHQRLGTVEPVFGNIQNKGIRRFTLRGKTKVDMQWKLYCMVHNLGKIHRYGMATAG